MYKNIMCQVSVVFINVIKYLVSNIKKYYDSRQIFHYMYPTSKESWPKGPSFGYPQRGFALLQVY